jgi:hypothetical protein
MEEVADCVNALVNGEMCQTNYFPPPIFSCVMIDTWISWSSFLSTWDSFPLP